MTIFDIGKQTNQTNKRFASYGFPPSRAITQRNHNSFAEAPQKVVAVVGRDCLKQVNCDVFGVMALEFGVLS